MRLVAHVAAALADIGLRAVEDENARGFLHNVAIVAGEIRYRPDALPSNLLHEAGHLACIPPAYRPLANGELTAVFSAMGAAMADRMAQSGNPDDPLIRAIIQCSDPEATAWAWAFGMRLGMPGEAIILDNEYDGAGDVVRLQVSSGQYIGVNGLRAAGMIQSTRDYPRLSKWVQDAL